jgi:benzodiazapine receptor
MSRTFAILVSLGVCVIGAILEGAAAGKNVKPVFSKLRFPKYSPPLPVWYGIGVLYYAIHFSLLYRILGHDGDVGLRYVSLTLVIIILAANAFWNYLFFRAQSLSYSSLLGALYALVAIALFICLIQFDRVASYFLLPYLLYLIYASWWSYGLLKLNVRDV